MTSSGSIMLARAVLHAVQWGDMNGEDILALLEPGGSNGETLADAIFPGQASHQDVPAGHGRVNPGHGEMLVGGFTLRGQGETPREC